MHAYEDFEHLDSNTTRSHAQTQTCQQKTHTASLEDDHLARGDVRDPQTPLVVQRQALRPLELGLRRRHIRPGRRHCWHRHTVCVARNRRAVDRAHKRAVRPKHGDALVGIVADEHIALAVNDNAVRIREHALTAGGGGGGGG